MNPHEKVHVGDTVHYVGPNADTGPADGPFPHRCYAALVTGLDDMELIGLDGTSYAENPLPMPTPALTTRWYLSLTVFQRDGGTYAVRDVPGPSPAVLGGWHFATDCAVPHRVDWETVSGRLDHIRGADAS